MILYFLNCSFANHTHSLIVTYETSLFIWQGDCDDDSDCAGDLECFKRDDGEDVPGCVGNTVKQAGTSTDYCYDIARITSKPTSSPKSASPSESPETPSPTVTTYPTMDVPPTTSDPTVSQGESPVTPSPSKTPTIVLPVLERSRNFPLPLENW